MNTIRKLLLMAVWILLASSQTRPCAVALGSALTPGQRQQMTAYFHAGPAAKVVTVRGPEHNAGNARMMSAACVLVQVGTPDSGVRVRVCHIAQVSALMYAVALGTAGVDRDQVVVAAPFGITGRGALPAVWAACQAAGQPVSPAGMRAAQDELRLMVLVGKHGHDMDPAARLFWGLSHDSQGLREGSLRQLVMGRAKRLGVTLTFGQAAEVARVMKTARAVQVHASTVPPRRHKVPGGLWRSWWRWVKEQACAVWIDVQHIFS